MKFLFMSPNNYQYRKLILTILFASVIFANLQCQIIKGKVVDASSNNALEYASIGVINTSIGTITNEAGEFNLNVEKSTSTSIVRFSMMGYEPVSLSIGELTDKDNIIKLNEKPIQLNEVSVSPNNVFRKIGITSQRNKVGLCGWGGDKRGKGHEIGSRFDLGNSISRIQKISFYIDKQSFNNCLLRMHIRSINNGIPDKELINENVLFNISKSSGWIDSDLNKYDIFLKGEVAVTLEWVNAFGVNLNNLKKMVKDKVKSSVILIPVTKSADCVYYRWGVEAPWSKIENQSPCMYLTIQ